MEIKDNNVCHIEGILSEVDIKKGSFIKNGSPMESIGGVIKIKVNQQLNGENVDLEVPVHMFAAKLTNQGEPNPAYESIERIMTDYVSIAAGGIEKADAVRINRGQITMNEYYNNNGVLVSFPRIMSSFVNKISHAECKPEASFITTFAIGQAGFKIDKDGVEDPNTYCITAILPKFGGKVDVVPFIATNKGVIDVISNYWKKGDTVKATGKLNFSSKVEIVKEEIDFGDPVEKPRTISVSELIITGGNQTPLEGDFAYDNAELDKGLAMRNAALEASKNKNNGKKSGASSNAGAGFGNLGF